MFLIFFFCLQRAIYLKTYCMNLIGISPHPRFLVLIKMKFQTFIAEKMDKNMDMWQDAVFYWCSFEYLDDGTFISINVSEKNFLMDDVCKIFFFVKITMVLLYITLFCGNVEIKLMKSKSEYFCDFNWLAKAFGKRDNSNICTSPLKAIRWNSLLAI